MQLVTLTTEWKPDDFYYGIIRGKLSRLYPGVQIIDNAGGIPVFNIAYASFVIRNTFASYPEGTIHILCVHSEAAEGQDHLIVRARNHYFIGTDNGIFNLVLNSEPDEMIKIKYDGISDELEIFARAAADLLSGKKLTSIGQPVEKINEKVPIRATIDKDVIIGSVIFIDSYGNAISNITREIFYRVFDAGSYRILIQSNNNFTETISSRYCDVPPGEILARFNSLDLLEIAINGADISELLSLEVGSSIRIENLSKKPSSNRLF